MSKLNRNFKRDVKKLKSLCDRMCKYAKKYPKLSKRNKGRFDTLPTDLQDTSSKVIAAIETDQLAPEVEPFP